MMTIGGIEILSQHPDNETLGSVVGSDVYKVINEMVLKAIDQKELVWRKPWSSINHYGFSATNFISKNEYRGANSFLLNFLIPYLRGKKWKNPYFMTFKQIEEKGGKVKKGAEGYFVTYFQMIYKLGNESITEEEYWSKYVLCANDEFDFCQDLKAIPMLRYYKVFNGDDIEGIDWKLKKVKPKSKEQKIESAEDIWINYPVKAPQLIHSDPDSAFYSPSKDIINLPVMEAFKNPQEYYGTLFHEMIHSTGHPTRLKRAGGKKFGDKAYSFEELVAELGACYLNGESGILFHTINNSAAYLKGWRSRLKRYINEDEKFFFSAASKAQEASDYILNRLQKDSTKSRIKKNTIGMNGENQINYTPEYNLLKSIRSLGRKTKTYPSGRKPVENVLKVLSRFDAIQNDLGNSSSVELLKRLVTGLKSEVSELSDRDTVNVKFSKKTLAEIDGELSVLYSDIEKQKAPVAQVNFLDGVRKDQVEFHVHGFNQWTKNNNPSYSDVLEYFQNNDEDNSRNKKLIDAVLTKLQSGK